MSNELVVRQAGFAISADDFETMQRMAKAMVASNYFSDVKDIAQAVVKIQAGSEIGIPPFAAITGIHIIKNKPVLGANMIATLVKNSGRYDYRIKRLDDEAAEIVFFENGEQVGESSFSIEDAKRAGLLNNNTWKSYPRNMLFSRAISNGARWYAPGIFGGSSLYTPDELGVDTDDDGAPVTVTVTRVDTDTGEITEQEPLPVAEFEEITPASETPATNGDSRGDTSPTAQAARADKRPSAKKAANGSGDVDHMAEARNAKNFTDFAKHAVEAIGGYDSVPHIVNTMTKKLYTNGFQFDPNNTDEYLSKLADYKESAAA